MDNNSYDEDCREYLKKWEEYKNNHTEIHYCKHYDTVWVKEQPFYRVGMNQEEITKELNYLNNHLESFYDGSYVPLWKQYVYNMWFK